MFDPSPFVNPTPLAHADTSRDVLPRGGTSQMDLSTPMPQRHHAFTNIHAFSGTRTQALRHSTQRHSRGRHMSWQLPSPNFDTTPIERRLSLDRFHGQQPPYSRQVFSVTRLEFMTRQP
ncbi:hypothetical protein TNCV_843871 [Trichonephila clavipes]|nr:hypothetical protein TNCV_843871 [Trichonephila clavipes]